ncbi:plasmid replication protein, CyRepA1 family, partial [Phormidium sp. FACHB-1136]|uniref:plasmid replication protein, CyRepA1 family n=1 Tax=Phormidium sp. FACHB-1136 TaxID=2692848 RepID=UPI0018F01789
EAARLNVLLLNSDTSSGELEKAVIMDPNTTITDYPIVIATPSMGTGVSIEVNHFDQVYGLFWGASSTDADMSQALARVRQPIPRIVWCAKYGRNFSKVGRDTNPLRLKKLLQDKANANAQMTAASLGALIGNITDYDWLNPHVHLWATLEAQRNRSMLSLRSALKVRLIHEGHPLTIERLDTHQEAKQQMAEARLQIKAAEARATASAVNLTAPQVKALEMAEHLDPDERLALDKWHLAEFYAIPLDAVTTDLVLLDNHGRYRGQLLELEAFLYPDTASAAVVRSVERQAQHHLGLCPWDISTAELRRQVRVHLGLDRWVNNPDEWLSDDDALAQFATQALALAPQVKAALNVSIKPEMRPQQILGQLLDQMGLTTLSRQLRQGNQQRTRSYQIDPDAKAQALAILARRAERRNASDHRASPPDTPPVINDQSFRGCDTRHPPKTDDLWVGQQVRWGSSLGYWVVLATEDESATIQLQNPIVQTVRTVPLADLIALELAG